MTAAVPVAPLSRAVCALVTMLSAGSGGRLLVHARSRAGVGQRRLMLLAEPAAEWMPAPLLELLEDDLWAITAGVPVVGEGSAQPVRIGALVVTFPVPTVYRNPEDVESNSGRRWMFDEQGLAAAAAQAHAFLAPSLLLDARTAVVALWALAQPVDVHDGEAQARVLKLHRRLALALGADEPAAERLEDLAVPVPGAVVREQEGLDVVSAITVDEGLTYTVDELEAAIAAKERA